MQTQKAYGVNPEEEIKRLKKIVGDLAEANRKKRNRINHQKQHIKRLQESIAILKDILGK